MASLVQQLASADEHFTDMANQAKHNDFVWRMWATLMQGEQILGKVFLLLACKPAIGFLHAHLLQFKLGLFLTCYQIICTWITKGLLP